MQKMGSTVHSRRRWRIGNGQVQTSERRSLRRRSKATRLGRRETKLLIVRFRRRRISKVVRWQWIDWSHQIKVGFRLGVTWLLVTGSFDLLSGHALAKGRTSTKEHLVVVRSSIGAVRESSKAVEIELSLEARELGLFEMPVNDICVSISSITTDTPVRTPCGTRVRIAKKSTVWAATLGQQTGTYLGMI